MIVKVPKFDGTGIEMMEKDYSKNDIKIIKGINWEEATNNDNPLQFLYIYSTESGMTDPYFLVKVDFVSRPVATDIPIENFNLIN